MHLSEWITQLLNLQAKYGDAVLYVDTPGGLPQFAIVSIGDYGYDTQIIVTPWFDNPH